MPNVLPSDESSHEAMANTRITSPLKMSPVDTERKSACGEVQTGKNDESPGLTTTWSLGHFRWSIRSVEHTCKDARQVDKLGNHDLCSVLYQQRGLNSVSME
jgi:hypothetical protein